MDKLTYAMVRKALTDQKRGLASSITNTKDADVKAKTLDQIKRIDEEIQQVVSEFIQANKPCNIGDFVEIITRSGRRVTGTVKELGIFIDQVYVKSYQPKSGAQCYLDSPFTSLRVIV